MPDPASGMEMDPEFRRLVHEFRCAVDAQDLTQKQNAIAALHSWHLDAVERARAGVVGQCRDMALGARDLHYQRLMSGNRKSRADAVMAAWHTFDGQCVDWLESQTNPEGVPDA